MYTKSSIKQVYIGKMFMIIIEVSPFIISKNK